MESSKAIQRSRWMFFIVFFSDSWFHCQWELWIRIFRTQALFSNRVLTNLLHSNGVCVFVILCVENICNEKTSDRTLFWTLFRAKNVKVQRKSSRKRPQNAVYKTFAWFVLHAHWMHTFKHLLDALAAAPKKLLVQTIVIVFFVCLLCTFTFVWKPKTTEWYKSNWNVETNERIQCFRIRILENSLRQKHTHTLVQTENKSNQIKENKMQPHTLFELLWLPSD